MSLVPRFVYGDLDLTEWPFAVEFGSDFGNPENVVDVVQTLLHDGEVLESSRRTNRTLRIPVLIDEADLAAVATAEAALIAEADKARNTLAIEPGDGIGATTVFETFKAQPRWTRDDDEEQAGVRRVLLEIPALPHGRSVDLTIDDAGTPPASGGTLLYAADSTTGWAKWAGSGSYTADTSIKTEGVASVRTAFDSSVPVDETYWRYDSRDEVTGLSLSTGSGGYLSVSVRWGVTTDRPAATSHLDRLWVTTASGGEVEVTDFMAVSTDANGFVHHVWPVDGSLTVTGFRFQVAQFGRPNQSANALVWYDDFELLPAATTDHQIVKQLTVGGSARTTGSLHIAAATDVVALDQVLAITAPTEELPPGFLPDGRRWITQGTTTADGTALGGSYLTPDAASYSTAAGKPIFDVPVGMLTPGPYSIVALVKTASSPLEFGVQAQLRYDTTDVGPVSAAEVSIPTASTTWQFVTVGTVYLPPLPMQSADSDAVVRLLFKGSAKLADVYMIPAWQVGGRAVADYTIVDCGTGTPSASGSSSNLWIDSPSVDQPRGGYWRGPTSDRVNARSAWPDAKRLGVHNFRPGRLSVFLVSTGAAGPTVSLAYYKAWWGNAGE